MHLSACQIKVPDLHQMCLACRLWRCDYAGTWRCTWWLLFKNFSTVYILHSHVVIGCCLVWEPGTQRYRSNLSVSNCVCLSLQHLIRLKSWPGVECTDCNHTRAPTVSKEDLFCGTSGIISHKLTSFYSSFCFCLPYGCRSKTPVATVIWRSKGLEQTDAIFVSWRERSRSGPDLRATSGGLVHRPGRSWSFSCFSIHFNPRLFCDLSQTSRPSMS